MCSTAGSCARDGLRHRQEEGREDRLRHHERRLAHHAHRVQALEAGPQPARQPAEALLRSIEGEVRRADQWHRVQILYRPDQGEHYGRRALSRVQLGEDTRNTDRGGEEVLQGELRPGQHPEQCQ